MHITLFMTMSLNGMTSRPDHREDFLSAENWDSFLECARETGALIWGRKTHEKVQRWNRRYFEQMKGLHKLVVSTNSALDVGEGFDLAASPRDAVAILERRGLRRATLGGGSILNSAFARERLIDAVVVNVEAVVIGRGLPLFAEADFDLRLETSSVRQLNDRIVQLKYRTA